MSQDYKKAKIYKITNDYNDEIYVGSTCDTLVKRFNRHKKSSKEEAKKKSPFYTLVNEIGFDRFRIQLICNYPCEDKYQLRQKEGEYIREFGTLNKNIAGRDKKTWEMDNKEHRDVLHKQYVNVNNDKIKEYQKQYALEYKENNRDKILEKLKLKTKCECGCTIRKYDISIHRNSKKHANLMELLNNQNSVEVSPETFIN